MAANIEKLGRVLDKFEQNFKVANINTMTVHFSVGLLEFSRPLCGEDNG